MTSSTPTPNATEQSDNSNITATLTNCTTSLSGSCELQYQLGFCPDDDLYIRINSSTGNGFYCRNWVSVDALWSHLSEWPHDTVTSLSLFKFKAWEFRSINTAGYALRALIDLGLLTASTEKQRHWDLVSEDQYQATVADLKKAHSPSRKGKAEAAA